MEDIQSQVNAETANSELEQELLRCISRLSFIGMGQSTELDEALVTLRESIKNDSSIDLIKDNIEDVSKALIYFEEKVSSLDKNEVNQALVLIDEFKSRQTLPNPLKDTIQQLEKQSQILEFQEIIIKVVDIIEAFLAEGTQSNQPGFFDKIFNRYHSVDNDDENKQKQTSNSPLLANPDGCSELKKSLTRLIEQLSTIENNQQLAKELNQKVDELSKIEQLIEIIQVLTDTYIEFAGREHQQFESFLKSLGQRIDRVNDFINQTTVFSKSFIEERQDLDNDLKNSVSEFKDTLDTSNNLSEIRQSLSAKVDFILERVNHFCIEQQSSHKKMLVDCEKLKDQLVATQDESARLKEMLDLQRVKAQTDSLTNLPNRYSYNDRLTQEYNRWRRYRSPLSLVVGDIDNFKKINDNHGHIVGDLVLKNIAKFLQNEIRESDFVARYGGEEFVILLPETNLVDATKAMNKLRVGLKEVIVDVEGVGIKVTMSLGIAEFEGSDTTKEVFNRADKALYRAKEKGRDQVCCQRAKKVTKQ